MSAARELDEQQAPELTGPERLEVARFGIHSELTMAEDF